MRTETWTIQRPALGREPAAPATGGPWDMQRVLYLCDPLLNRECLASNCYLYNYRHLPDPCRRTSNPAYAIKGADKQPIVAPTGVCLMDLREETFPFPEDEEIWTALKKPCVG